MAKIVEYTMIDGAKYQYPIESMDDVDLICEELRNDALIKRWDENKNIVFLNKAHIVSVVIKDEEAD